MLLNTTGVLAIVFGFQKGKWPSHLYDGIICLPVVGVDPQLVEI